MWSIAGDVLLVPKQGAPTLHSVDSVILSLSPREDSVCPVSRR